MRARRCSVVSSLLVVVLGAALPLIAGPGAQTNGARVGIAAEPKWPTLGGNFRRDGQSGDFGPLEGGVRWKFETDGAVAGSVTVGSDGRIHLACEDGKLYTLDSDGSLVWVCDVNCALLTAPSIGSDGSLYVGDKDGKLCAVDPDGRLRWTYTTNGEIYSSPAVDAGGNVYVGSADGMLYALNGQTGEELWQFRTKGAGLLFNGAIFASPSIGLDGTVYVAGLYDPSLYALNPADGSIKWVCRFPANSDDPDTGGWSFVSPVVAKDGTIYQTLLYDPNLYAIEPATGVIRWSVNLCDPHMFGGSANAPTASDGWSEPVVAPDGTIYVSLDDPYLRAVHPSGILRWVAHLGSLIEETSPWGWAPDLTGISKSEEAAEEAGGFTLTVDGSGIVYAASDSGVIYVVSPGSLTIGEFTTGGWPAFPVIAADDLLILADSKDYSSLNTGEKNAIWAIAPVSASTPTRGASRYVLEKP
ncbi:MAG: PQQ-like beta-propeller repeat protein [Phycisphaerae bacterium]|nr:PQQ-like beta-propeller repeat protein [Phycisphaerae bacterium]